MNSAEDKIRAEKYWLMEDEGGPSLVGFSFLFLSDLGRSLRPGLRAEKSLQMKIVQISG